MWARSGGTPCGVCASAGLNLNETPTLRPTGQALLLLFESGGWSIHEAEHLIHWLASGWVAVREPALAIVGAAVFVAPPIAMFAWILMYLVDH